MSWKDLAERASPFDDSERLVNILEWAVIFLNLLFQTLTCHCDERLGEIFKVKRCGLRGMRDIFYRNIRRHVWRKILESFQILYWVNQASS